MMYGFVAALLVMRSASAGPNAVAAPGFSLVQLLAQQLDIHAENVFEAGRNTQSRPSCNASRLMLQNRTHNNFGGQGPDGGAPTVRYSNVLVEKGQTLDLVLHASSPYSPVGHPDGTLARGIGYVHLASHSDVVVSFTFVASGTDDQVVVESFWFSFLDIDGDKDAPQFHERITVQGYASALLSNGTQVNVTESPEGFTTFASTVADSTGGKTNPNNPVRLTQEQIDRSVQLLYQDTAMFVATLSARGGKTHKMRSFMFAGMINGLVDESDCTPSFAPTPVPTPRPVETTTTTTCDPQASKCLIWGDPHVITFDLHRERLKRHPLREALFRADEWKTDEVSIYDVGTFWLVKNELIHIQGRYWNNNTHPHLTSLGALAVGGPFLRNQTLIFRSLGVGHVTWNGEPILKTFPSDFATELVVARYHKDSEMVMNGKRGPGVDVTLPRGVRLTVNMWRHNLAVAIYMHPQPGGQDGHCGNFNGDAKDDVQLVLLERAGGRVPVRDLLF